LQKKRALFVFSLDIPYIRPEFTHTMETKSNFTQTNAFAMQNGLFLGLWSIAGLCLAMGGINSVLLSGLGQFLLYASPFFAAWLTLRFRKTVTEPTEPFSFGRGYIHTLLMGLYAGLWIAIFVYVYFRFLDGGQLWSLYAERLASPEMEPVVKQIEESGVLRDMQTGSAISVNDLMDNLKALPPASYSASVVSFTLFSAPIISLFIGLATRRS